MDRNGENVELRPIATVDAVVMTIVDQTLKVLLHRRPKDPYKNIWALPGGYIHVDEDAGTDATMQRILKDKVGVSDIYFEQLATYSGPVRDPRGWSLSIAHLALVPDESLDFEENDDVTFVAVDALPPLAFDHDVILADALARLRGKGAYSTLPASFLPKEFTLFQLRRAYEIVLGETLDRVAFRRKVMSAGFLEETGELSDAVSRRPAMLYRMTVGTQTYNRTFAMNG